MITSAPTKLQLDRWRRLWQDHRESFAPDRKNGQQLIEFLAALYPLEETVQPEILGIVSENITANSFFAEKLPAGSAPSPRAFYIRNEGNGALLYRERGEVFADVERIIAGVDMVSGCFITEGSERLWDQLCAYQGLDEADLENFVRTGQCLECREDKRLMIGNKVTVTVDRPLGSAHPKHPDIIYPVNYGYVEGIAAPDGDWQDAYILGVDRPVAGFSGTIIAVIVRQDDVEDKWVVAPEDIKFTMDQVAGFTRFQEQYFRSQIIM